MFSDIYQDKKVLITGHTGFKGTWLSAWLLKLGANIVGFSKDIPTEPAMFEVLNLHNQIQHSILDVRDFNLLKEKILEVKPDFIFHLAAQPIVSTSYNDPLETVSSNVMGTTNLLEVLRLANHKCTAIIITSDKAYDNVEQVWGYKENDPMGGKDVYSGSKGAAELIVKSYYHSFFALEESKVRLAVARAGNVIGGGDWAKDRIVVDAMVAWSKGEKVTVRSPNSTRPWQHVLEPLSGYLYLGQKLHNDIGLNGESFNFGPRAEQNRTVSELLVDLLRHWGIATEAGFTITDNIPFHESSLLKLNCDKALSYLKWQANLGYKDTIKLTGEWYYNFYNDGVNNLTKTLMQISEYESLAKERGLVWTE